jgi:hypothetical protein
MDLFAGRNKGAIILPRAAIERGEWTVFLLHIRISRRSISC